MNYDDIINKMDKTVGVFENNLAEVRAGRANPAILNKIKIDYYGVPTPISQVAGISVPEARLIVIQPWDLGILKEIEKIPTNVGNYFGIPPHKIGNEFSSIELEEKPEKPKSRYAVPGLYFYDNSVVEKAKALKPSPRGELEITDLNKAYMDEGTLKVDLLGRGMAWLDTGTHVSMLKASNFVEAVQTTQGTFIACLEEIAYRQGWISKEKVIELAQPLMKTEYGKYLIDIIEE